MRPAFSSTKQAAAFALLLLAVLLAPVLVGKNLLPPREQGYAAQGWGSGPYPWIRQQLFEETNAIDIVFVGSSHLFNAINTPYVQAQLSARLGRPAVVRTLAWGGSGYDALYFITRDLLAQRSVRLLVFYDENPTGANRNNQATFWFRWGEDADQLRGLPLNEKGLFYFASLVGLPRQLLCWVRPNLPAPLVTDKPNYWETIARSPNPAAQLGCLSVQLGFAPDLRAAPAPFVPYEPSLAATPSAIRYTAGTATNFTVATAPLPDWQRHFARRFADLLAEKSVPAAMLYLPVFAEVRAPAIPLRANWPELFPAQFTLLGLTPPNLFGELTEDDLQKLFADPYHFNQNGQAYFTRLITPGLLSLYEAVTAH